VAFYALVPNDPLMSRALPGFLRDLTAAYQTANLGAHEPAIEDNIRWYDTHTHIPHTTHTHTTHTQLRTANNSLFPPPYY
jgi:hypothetical protein